jgi:hypothetical protein
MSKHKKICPKVLNGDCPFGDERGACYHAKLHMDAQEQCEDNGISGDPNDSRQCGSCISYAKLSKNDKLKVMLMEL